MAGELSEMLPLLKNPIVIGAIICLICACLWVGWYIGSRDATYSLVETAVYNWCKDNNAACFDECNVISMRQDYNWLGNR